MRIEAYTQVQQAYKSTYASKAETKQNVAKSDKLQISSFGKDITSAMQAVKDAPDIRPEVVEPIKEKIDNGTYEVTAALFGEKISKEYLGLS
ncbi:MAG: flagellar biosynthesis anti-sigma factor FlgM [Lachnospiraceae bacterium]|jgi:negative regulator of flagellin synthesis FlgM|nr:flagellar biosynthesis anti-sigma factor FlgM [Lachnospiraceae bacterium]